MSRDPPRRAFVVVVDGDAARSRAFQPVPPSSRRAAARTRPTTLRKKEEEEKKMMMGRASSTAHATAQRLAPSMAPRLSLLGFSSSFRRDVPTTSCALYFRSAQRGFPPELHTPTLCEEHLRADTSPAELLRSTRCCASNTCTNRSASSCAAVAVCTNTSTFACHRAPPPRSRNALPTSRDYVGGALAPLHSERPSPDERRTPNAAPSESLRLGNAAMQLAVWKRGDGVRCSSGTVLCIAVCTPGRKGPPNGALPTPPVEVYFFS